MHIDLSTPREGPEAWLPYHSATRCFPLAQLCRRGTADPLHQHPSFACSEHQEPETPLLLVLHLYTSGKAGGLLSTPKTRRRRTGPAGRLLPTSQLVQRSGFEMLVSCKQVNAVKTETYFFAFSYFHISVSHCQCRSCVQWLLSCTWLVPQKPFACAFASVGSQSYFFVRISDKCNLQNVFLFFCIIYFLSH